MCHMEGGRERERERGGRGRQRDRRERTRERGGKYSRKGGRGRGKKRDFNSGLGILLEEVNIKSTAKTSFLGHTKTETT